MAFRLKFFNRALREMGEAPRRRSGRPMACGWKQEVEADKNTAKQLLQNAPAADKSYYDLTPKELESTLVEVHRLQVQVDGLRNKYDAAVRADDEERKHIREDVRARFTPK